MMTDYLIKIAPAINKIDGGCSICIKSFLARCYIIEEFDMDKVVEHIDQLSVAGLKKAIGDERSDYGILD